MGHDCRGAESNVIYVKYITKNGRRIYPKKAKAFRLLVSKKKSA